MTSDEMLAVRPYKILVWAAQHCPVHACVGLMSACLQRRLRWKRDVLFCSGSVLPPSFPGRPDDFSSPWGLVCKSPAQD